MLAGEKRPCGVCQRGKGPRSAWRACPWLSARRLIQHVSLGPTHPHAPMRRDPNDLPAEFGGRGQYGGGGGGGGGGGHGGYGGGGGGGRGGYGGGGGGGAPHMDMHSDPDVKAENFQD
jgi:hypothetical protein